MTTKALSGILSTPLGELDVVVLCIDGIAAVEHTVVCALGVDMDGRRRLLGLWEGATGNGSVCRGLLRDLVERGLKTDRGLLAAMDVSKALRRAAADVLGRDAPVQECQVHKLRNVLDHLSEE